MSDMRTCAESVYKSEGNRGHSQPCSRKAGFGPGGKYCRQHSEKYIDLEPTATWYKTATYAFEIEPVAVIKATEKLLLIKGEYSRVANKTSKHGMYYDYWETRQEAVECLERRLESMRAALIKAEKEFNGVSKLD